MSKIKLKTEHSHRYRGDGRRQVHVHKLDHTCKMSTIGPIVPPSAGTSFSFSFSYKELSPVLVLINNGFSPPYQLTGNLRVLYKQFIIYFILFYIFSLLLTHYILKRVYNVFV